MILRGSNEVDELSHLSLIRRFVEQFYQVYIIRLAPEMHFEEVVDGGLQHERIVDCYQTNMWIAIPAGLRTASDGAIHKIVSDEKITL